MNIKKIINEINFPAKFKGNDFDFEIMGLTIAKTKGKMCTFVQSEKFIKDIPDNANIILTTEKIAMKINDKNICIVDNPKLTFFLVHNYLKDNPDYITKNEKTKIGKNSKISPLTTISENNVSIGDNVTIEDFVKIEENVTIGDNSIIRSGTTIGSQGYQYQDQGNTIFLVNHYGFVNIGKNVEIKNNSSIDKAIYPWDETKIGNFVKIDKLACISHGVKIEDLTKIGGRVAIAGRVEIGKNTWIGMGATLRNGIKIGNNASVNLGAVVTKDVKDFESVSGNFAIEHNKFLEFIKNIAK